MIIEMSWSILKIQTFLQLSKSSIIFLNCITSLFINEDTTWRSYKALLRHTSVVKNLVEGGDTYALEALYINVSIYFHSGQSVTHSNLQLHKGSNAAMGDDTCNLKSALVTWINEYHSASQPCLQCNSKVERGLDNDHTGHLLCPAEHNWDDME